jgi:cell division septation protein DedD
VVRLGSFGDKANADGLLQKLLAANHKAYSRQVQTTNGTLQVVYVGPVLTSAEAGSLLATLAQDFQLQGVVETFTPPALQ